MGLTVHVVADPPRGLTSADLVELVALTAPASDRVAWCSEPFTVRGEPGLPLALATKVQSDDVQASFRDVVRVLAFALRLSKARPGWVLRVTDDLGLLEARSGGDVTLAKGGRVGAGRRRDPEGHAALLRLVAEEAADVARALGLRLPAAAEEPDLDFEDQPRMDVVVTAAAGFSSPEIEALRALVRPFVASRGAGNARVEASRREFAVRVLSRGAGDLWQVVALALAVSRQRPKDLVRLADSRRASLLDEPSLIFRDGFALDIRHDRPNAELHRRIVRDVAERALPWVRTFGLDLSRPLPAASGPAPAWTAAVQAEDDGTPRILAFRIEGFEAKALDGSVYVKVVAEVRARVPRDAGWAGVSYTFVRAGEELESSKEFPVTPDADGRVECRLGSPSYGLVGLPDFEVVCTVRAEGELVGEVRATAMRTP